jgi:hypothetical protein
MDYDFEEELRGDEGDMNVKAGGLGYIAVAIVVGIIPPIVSRWIDRTDQTPTQVALGKLEEKVSELNSQVSKLTDQPYVRRDEFEGRVSGLEQRVSNVERQEQPNSHREGYRQ